jgi:hypothetical protein
LGFPSSRLAIRLLHRDAFNSALAVAMTLAMMITSGCSSQSSTQSSTQTPLTDEHPTSDESSVRGNAPETDGENEYWDLVHVGGAPVGYTVTKIRRQLDRDEIEIDVDTQISIQRFGTETKQSMSIRSVESADARIRTIQTTMTSGEGQIESHITNDGKLLRITSRAAGQATSQATGQAAGSELPSDCVGVIAVEQDLLQHPLKVGESRTYRQFIPFMNTIADVRLVGKKAERTSLLDGDRELLRIENVMTLEGGTKIVLTMWTNDDGEVLKTDMAGLQTTYRTTKAIATATGSTDAFDLGETSLVTIDLDLPDPHETSMITYRATIDGQDPMSFFAQGTTQSVKLVSKNTVEIVVRAIRPETNDASTETDKPSAEYLASNALIQGDDPAVRNLADFVPVGRSDWERASALEKLVNELISEKNFSTAFASASEVAKTKAGDCTEHSVLLCALCRAKQIPARCAVGLVYYPPSRAFAYHMWSEVWINGKWIPLDATLGRGGIGAAHIKVSDTSLAEGSGFESMLPVIQLIGKLKLEIVDVERNLE